MLNCCCIHDRVRTSSISSKAQRNRCSRTAVEMLGSVKNPHVGSQAQLETSVLNITHSYFQFFKLLFLHLSLSRGLSLPTEVANFMNLRPAGKKLFFSKLDE